MVEITFSMFRKRRYILSGFALLVGAALCAQPPVEARIAGLEDNAEYMTLLRQDALLQQREDSVVRVAEVARRRLREEPAARQELSARILELESRIFEIRNAKGRLIDRINTIEQEWVLTSLDRGEQPAAQQERPAFAAEAAGARTLAECPCFGELLDGEDHARLLKAERLEHRAAGYADRYRTNYADLALLAADYAAATTEEAATELYERYTALQGLNRSLADSLAATWNYIFDSKSYAYNYLLEAMGREERLAEEERLLAEAAQRLSSLRGRIASPEVADYILRKRVITAAERDLAGELGLPALRDSLGGVTAELARASFDDPPVEVEERYFLLYDSLVFTPTPLYTYQNPIPECRVYERGTIYRILLGTFNTKRAVSTFRGAAPLGYLVDEAGKWSYYAGGFATREEAEAAQALCKRKGFQRPEVVVWNDGESRNLSRDPEAAGGGFRLEITGADTLSEAVRAAIASLGEGHELSRAGTHFVLGGFDDRGEAERAAAAIAGADGSLQIKIGEVAE